MQAFVSSFQLSQKELDENLIHFMYALKSNPLYLINGEINSYSIFSFQ